MATAETSLGWAGGPDGGQAEAGQGPGTYEYFAQEREAAFVAQAPANSRGAHTGATDQTQPLSPGGLRDVCLRVPRVDDILLGQQFRGERASATAVTAGELLATCAERRKSGGFGREFQGIQEQQRAGRASGGDGAVAGREACNLRKNRDGDVLPKDATRVVLAATRQPGSDYINASFVDGWRRPRAFIATQAPLPATVGDFWRMVWEHGTSVVVMLVDPRDPGGGDSSFAYWPATQRSAIKTGGLQVELISTQAVNQKLTLRRFLVERPDAEQGAAGSGQGREGGVGVSGSGRVSPRPPQPAGHDGAAGGPKKKSSPTGGQGTSNIVVQFCLSGWGEEAPFPEAGLVIDLARRVQAQEESARMEGRGGGPTVVHCSAGIAQTGVFIAAYISAQRLLDTGTVDVPVTVRHLRSQRPQAVPTEGHYTFIYDVIAEFYSLRIGSAGRTAGLSGSGVGAGARLTHALSRDETIQLWSLGESSTDVDVDLIIDVLNSL